MKSAITKEDVSLNKKSHIKILKMAVFDCAINEKCCSVDGDEAFAIFCPRGGGGGGGAQVKLTDALITSGTSILTANESWSENNL